MGGSLKSKNGDSGAVVQTYNESATGAPEQLQIKHNYGDVDINNLRGALNLKAVATCETPTASSHIANKAYVDAAVSNGVAGVGETDTLASVTARGASTSVTSTFSGGINVGDLTNGGITGSNYNITGVNNITINDPGEGITWGGGTNTVTLYNIDDANDNIMNFMNAAEVRVNNSTLATQSYVNTQVSNLVASAPSTLDTLNELAAALGDDPNFATTVTNNIATKVSKSGDTMTGQLYINHTNDAQLHLQSPSTWTGIGFNDSASTGTQYIWHYGGTGTFAIGGGGSTVSGKKLHIDGGTSIGVDFDNTSVPANGLAVQGAIYTTQINNTRMLEGSFTINGDANTYYPVYWWGGDQTQIMDIEIYRSYNATAPSTWNTATHKGGLNMRLSANFGGWGGASYDSLVTDFRQTYSNMVSEIGWFGNNRGFCIWLRGGGAIYHYKIKGPRNNAPTVALSAVDPGGNNTGVAPRSDAPQTRLLRDFVVTRHNGQFTTTISVSGDVNATGDVCAYTTSDVSFKENVAPISNPLDKVMAIRGVEFDWSEDFVNTRGGIDGYFTRKHDVGVIAQEVEAVMPEVVGTKTDGTKGVRYEKMVGLLIEAIKDQQQQIEELKSKLEGK